MLDPKREEKTEIICEIIDELTDKELSALCEILCIFSTQEFNEEDAEIGTQDIPDTDNLRYSCQKRASNIIKMIMKNDEEYDVAYEIPYLRLIKGGKTD